MKQYSRRSFGKLTVGVGMSVVVGLTELQLLRPSHAAVAIPAIGGTATWGAAAPKEPIKRLAQKPIGIVVHHTTSPNSNDFTQTKARQVARSIQQSHFNRGWIDTGQHFTISRGGWILEGRHQSLAAVQQGTTHVQGAHVDGHNETHIGIECDGLYMEHAPSLPLWNNLVALLAYLCHQYGLTAQTIVGHRDLDATLCPGDTFYSLLPQLRAAVETHLAGGNVGRMWPTLKRNTPATSLAKTAQYLLRTHGASITADGAFGPATEAAVKAFQTAKGLTVNGIIGAATWESLIRTVRLGDSGDAVRAVQTRLAAQGYTTTSDGQFTATLNALVKTFQTNRQLSVDGVVGINSWNHLAM
ncbi:N-acetylmuramoyl-L-alanine amidase family 2 (plasmid) [Herpetosiphon aurantiacus DSM 785]|uniref:N-acetylmuramoyl-L-alanine amidase family 2 n=1 Tax=Herpetosiphon aurantiacus (strain ATCC 23779 / DSM 785 / 114-95) TaxID=316274 RepID=A9B906_HERA2|nr:N-acetylmuramoyl-L-alanine amidase family 2 [Herpetosiphon aurantiacus DSM 785]